MRYLRDGIRCFGGLSANKLVRTRARRHYSATAERRPDPLQAAGKDKTTGDAGVLGGYGRLYRSVRGIRSVCLP